MAGGPPPFDWEGPDYYGMVGVTREKLQPGLQ